jgi:hypothetical protein
MCTKIRETEEKMLLLFVNVIQKFRIAVQMCEPPYIQVEHRTQLSKLGCLGSLI